MGVETDLVVAMGQLGGERHGARTLQRLVTSTESRQTVIRSVETRRGETGGSSDSDK